MPRADPLALTPQHRIAARPYTDGVTGSRNEAFARVAHLFGRLAHVFADREAILERHALHEDAYRALERRTIEALLAASPAELAHFARAFAEERAELLGITPIAAAAPSQPGPVVGASVSPPARPPAAAPVAPAMVPGAPGASAPPAPIRLEARTIKQAAYDPAAIDDLMETLHSPPNMTSPRPPK